MGIEVFKVKLSAGGLEAHALGFLPEEIKGSPARAMGVFAHGYTSHKGSLLTWASKLCNEGMPILLFDIPGHYLGGFFEVSSFELFKEKAHYFFYEGFKALQEKLEGRSGFGELILGGHSLGALLSLKALELPELSLVRKRSICVGLGTLPQGEIHLFETSLYKSTLNLRGQLVSSEISPDKIFPWIREQKDLLKISNQKIHMIAGEDDIVVGKNGPEKLVDFLMNQNNDVTLFRPKKLPHHLPEQAASWIKKYLKDEKLLSS